VRSLRFLPATASRSEMASPMAVEKRGADAARIVAAPSPAKFAKHAIAAAKGEEGAVPSIQLALRTPPLMPKAMPPKVLEMLALGTPFALRAAVGDRHEAQATVVEQLKEVFDEATGELAARLAEAQAAADAKNVEVEASAAKVVSFAEEVEGLDRAIEVATQAVGSKREAARAAEKELKAKEAVHKSALKDQANFMKQKETFKAIETDGFDVLVEGTAPTEKDAKKVCNKLMKDLEKLGADTSLLVSSPAVLLKPKDQRQGFDQMVIDSLRGALAERIIAVDAALEASAAASHDAEAAVEAHSATAEACRRDLDAGGEALQKLKAQRLEKQEAKRAEEAAVEASRARHAEEIDRVAEAQAAVESLRGVSQAFEALAARSCAVPAEGAPADAPVAGPAAEGGA